MQAVNELTGGGHKAELGRFLLRRRARLTTKTAGLPTTRRRMPGLRRDEVAELADINTAIYSWF